MELPEGSEAAVAPEVSSDESEGDSHVFMGNITSPEKQSTVAKLANRRRKTLNPAELRRSVKLQDSESEDEESSYEEDENPSMQAVEGETDANIMNETPSVLARRIIRAHDNPSPPPQLISELNPLLPAQTGSFHDEGSLAVTREGTMTLSDIIMGAPIPGDVEDGSLGVEADATRDLISFKSISTPSNSRGQHPNIPILASTPLSAMPVHAATVDELLARSPLPQPALTRVVEQTAFVEEGPASSSVSEDEKLVDISTEMDVVPPAPGSEVSTSDEQGDALDVEMQLAPSTESSAAGSPPTSPSPVPEVAETPVRRSSRLSLTPKSSQLVASPGAGLSSRVASPARQKPLSSRDKGKQRAISPHEVEGTPRAQLESTLIRQKRKDKSATSYSRELESLSPRSARLLPSILGPSKSEATMDTIDEAQGPSTPERPAVALAPIPTPMFTAQRTPMRTAVQRPNSPSKIMSLQDPLATPARRIPIGQHGRSVPRSLSFMSTSSTLQAPLFTGEKPMGSPARRVLIDTGEKPMGSPARRVLIDQSKPPPASKRAAPSPLFPRPRSVSNDPKAAGSTVTRRSASAEPTIATPSGSTPSRATSSKLPFPLVPSHATIPEENESSNSQTSPVKSNLRAPSSASRIPRIGQKPYSRSPSTRASTAAHRREPSPALGANARASGSNSAATAKPADSTARTKVIPPTGIPSTPTLKRKREVATAVITRPLRQVGPQSPQKAASLRKVPLPTGSSPVKVVAVEKVEPLRVSPRRRTDKAVASSSTLTPERAVSIIDMSSPVGPSASLVKLKALAKAVEIERASSPAPDAEEEEEEPGRRITRQRKGRKPAADMFGTVDIRPTPGRRKAPASRTNPHALAGMTAVALKALTTSNTFKNQHYLAAKLQREVVRINTDRPESPTRVRTTAQRELDDKAKSREERAARRAGAGPGDGDDAGEESDSHPRGPGEEEDYRTPARPMKRLRLTEGEDEIEGITISPLREKKQVKWDRGVPQAICVDEIEVRTKACPPTEDLPRGALGAAAKALQLDTLGNLIAAKPLDTLVSEEIVVKKFVYNGEEVEEDELPELEVEVAVRTTRSMRAARKK